MSSKLLAKDAGQQRPELIVASLNFEQSQILYHWMCSEFRNEIIQMTQPGYQYTINHIKYVGKSIHLKYPKSSDGKSNQHNMIFMAATFDKDQQPVDLKHNLELFGNALSDFHTSESKYLCIIASLDGKHWVVLFFWKQDNKIFFLYFDPLEKELSPTLKSMVNNYVRAEVSTHFGGCKTDDSHINSTDTGPVCLRYLEMSLSLLYQPKDLISSLQSKSRFQVLAEMNLLPYQCSRELVAIKKRFQEMWYQQIVLTYFVLVAQNRPFMEFYEFKEELRKYMGKYGPLQEVSEYVVAYLNTLKGLFESGENSTDVGKYENQLLQDAKHQLNNSKFLTQLIQQGEKILEDTQIPISQPIVFSDEDLAHLNTKNAWLTTVVTEGFSALSKATHNSKICTEVLQAQLQEILGFTEEISQKLCQSKDSTDEKTLNDEEIKGLASFMNPLKHPASDLLYDDRSTNASETKSFEELLTEFLQENQEEPNNEFAIRQAYAEFLTDIWREASLETIKEWCARETKEKSFHPEVPEVIAVLDRITELLTGQRLRSTQILTLIVLGCNRGGNGKLCRIQPREEQTATAAMLAAMAVLRGERYVDVVMLSEALAEEALQEHAEFYQLLGITATTNNPDANENSECHVRSCYSANIVYGTFQTFKNDYLLDIYGSRRGNRGFGKLILDEVGPQMSEDALSMVTLAGTIPGLESLQNVYNNIWTALLTVEETSANEIADELSQEKEELLDGENISPEDAQNVYADLCRALKMTIYDKIHKDVEHQVKATCKKEVPAHLAELVASCTDTWIDSAMVARYRLKENVDYYLAPGEAADVMILPVEEDASTFRTTFSHEIYQFLVLKHNLQSTNQNLVICAISNFGYISLYGSNLLALTSTLGSTHEQEVMRAMYSVDFLRIPTFKTRRFQEIDGRVISDRNWAKYVAVDANVKSVQDGRAVLIICKTIDDCEKVEYCMKVFETIRPPKPYKEFEEYSSKFRSIRLLTNELDVAVSPNVVFPGDVIVTTSSIATSLNLTSSRDVDSNGGLHVCLGFCPKTERQKETLFRNARQGDLSSGQILARFSEVQISASLTAVTADENKVHIPRDTERETPSLPKFTSHVGTGLKSSSSKTSADGMAEYYESGQMITDFYDWCENEMAPSGSQASDNVVPGTSTMKPTTGNLLVDDIDGYEAEDEKCDEKTKMETPSEHSEGDENVSKVSHLYSDLDEHLFARLLQTWDPILFESYDLDPRTATTREKKECVWKNLLASMTEIEKVNLLKLIQRNSKRASKKRHSKLGGDDGTNPMEYSKQDQYLLSVLQEYWSPTSYLFFGLNPDTATIEQKHELIFNNMLAKEKDSEKKELFTHLEYLNPQCYKFQLWEIDEQMRVVKLKHGQIRAENMEDFAVTRGRVEKIGQFWTEPPRTHQTENEEIKAVLFKSDQNVMQNLGLVLQELHQQEKLFQQFWYFYRGYFSFPGSPSSKGFPSPQDYLDSWAIWIYTRDLSRNEDQSGDITCKGGNTAKRWKDRVETAVKNLFNEFEMHVKSQGEEYIRSSKQDRIQNSPSLSSREIKLQQGTHLITSLPSATHFDHAKAFKPSNLEGLIQKTMLMEIELLGLDVLNYLRKPQGGGKISDGMKRIAAGVGALARSKGSVDPAALSDASTVGVLLITEGIMKITLDLLNIEEGGNPDVAFYPKSQVIIYAITLLSSEGFEINLANMKSLELAANECQSYAKALRQSKLSSPFHLFLQRLGVHLKRILLTVKNSLRKYSVKGATKEFLHLPIISQDRTTLSEDCRKDVGTFVMNRIEAIFKDTMVKECKPKIKKWVEHCMQQLKEPISYKLEFVNEETFLDACLTSFDDYFQSSCKVYCQDIVDEIRENSLGKIPLKSPKDNESCVRSSISEISQVFLFKLESYLKSVQVPEDVAISDSDTLLEYALEVLTEKIYDKLQDLENDSARTDEVEPTLLGTEDFADGRGTDNTNCKITLHTDFVQNANVVGKYYLGSVRIYDSLLKYQLAYMMDTVQLQRDFDYLDSLKESGSISTIEDLNILTKDLGCCFEIKCKHTGRMRKVGLDIFGTVGLEIEKKPGCRRELYRINQEAEGGVAGPDDAKEYERFLGFMSRKLGQGSITKDAEGLWKHLIQFREARIKKSVDWHTKMQSKFFQVLDGSLRFPQLPVNEDKDVGWSDVEELDIGCEIVVDDSEAKVGDMQELNSILKGNTQLQFGHTVKKHSSPQSGLDFVKRNTKVKHLSTFENYERLAEAFAACIRKIRNKVEVLPFIRGIDFEIHLDASQLELANPLRMYEIRRDAKKKPMRSEDKLMVNFITLILGTRHQASLLSLDTRRFFHVQTVVPRSERPQDLAEGEPYCIKIRSRASEAYMVGGSEKWNKVNEKFFAWKNPKPSRGNNSDRH